MLYNRFGLILRVTRIENHQLNAPGASPHRLDYGFLRDGLRIAGLVLKNDFIMVRAVPTEMNNSWIAFVNGLHHIQRSNSPTRFQLHRITMLGLANHILNCTGFFVEAKLRLV